MIWSSAERVEIFSSAATAWTRSSASAATTFSSAARLTYDADPGSLQQILGVWTGIGSYSTRVATIRSGTGGVPVLDATNVTDDGARDLLIGGQGLDWYFGVAPDVFIGKSVAEQVN